MVMRVEWFLQFSSIWEILLQYFGVLGGGEAGVRVYVRMKGVFTTWKPVYKHGDLGLYMCLISLILVRKYGHIFVINSIDKKFKITSKIHYKMDQNRQNFCIISTKNWELPQK